METFVSACNHKLVSGNIVGLLVPGVSLHFSPLVHLWAVV
jgi:hypothetical protein